MPTVSHEFTITRDQQAFTLRAEAKGYYTPEIGGLPKDSMPAEGEITELVLFLGDEPWTGTLTSEEQTALDTALMALTAEGDD